MSRADPPIRQWTLLKLLESNEKMMLRRRGLPNNHSINQERI